MFYNLGSITLGLLAWFFAVIGLNHGAKFQSSSYICCCIALVLQFLELRRLCEIGDLSAVLDTINGITICAIVLTTVTILINLYASRKRRMIEDETTW